MYKNISYLLSIYINREFRGKSIAYSTIAGLVKVIKEDYKESKGLKLDEIITSEGEKASARIAERLKEKGIISGYEFVKNDFNNYVFLAF